MKSSSVSKCCKASISVAGSDEGTMFFVCDNCHKSCDVLLPGEKPKSPPFNLERFKETAQKAKETFNKCTCQPENNTVEKLCTIHNPNSGIAWALKELGWDEPEYGWTHEKEVLNKLIAEAEQRGYERGKRESHPIHGGQG